MLNMDQKTTYCCVSRREWMGCWGLLGWLLMIMDHSRKIPTFSTSKTKVSTVFDKKLSGMSTCVVCSQMSSCYVENSVISIVEWLRMFKTCQLEKNGCDIMATIILQPTFLAIFQMDIYRQGKLLCFFFLRGKHRCGNTKSTPMPTQLLPNYTLAISSPSCLGSTTH